MANAIINVTNLRLRTFIGFNQEEREKKQDVVINLEIHYPAHDACKTDEVDQALNYKVITKEVITLV
ncbi:FolB domain-containing protein, partial [Psychrobacter sp. CAL346-MNA-CIBAN-0220]